MEALIAVIAILTVAVAAICTMASRRQSDYGRIQSALSRDGMRVEPRPHWLLPRGLRVCHGAERFLLTIVAGYVAVRTTRRRWRNKELVIINNRPKGASLADAITRPVLFLQILIRGWHPVTAASLANISDRACVYCARAADALAERMLREAIEEIGEVVAIGEQEEVFFRLAIRSHDVALWVSERETESQWHGGDRPLSETAIEAVRKAIPILAKLDRWRPSK